MATSVLDRGRLLFGCRGGSIEEGTIYRAPTCGRGKAGPVDDKHFGEWDLGLDGEPEFDGTEAGDGVEGVVVALVERDGAARGDGGDVAGSGEPGTPHFFEGLRDLGNVVGVEKDGVFERGNGEMNEIGGESGEGGDFDSGEIIEGGMIGLRIVVDAVGDMADLSGDMANVLAETLPELRNGVHGLVVITPA